MRYKIDQHDYDVRIGHAVRFLKAGDKLHLKVDGLGEQFHEIIDE